MKITDYLYAHPETFVFMVVLVCIILIAVMICFVQQRLLSEQKIAKAALEIKKITDSVRAGVVNFYLEDFRIIYASNGFFSILGYSKEEAKKLRQTSMFDYIFPEDIPEFLELKSILMQGSAKCEVRMINKQEQRVWMLMDAKCVEHKDGNKTISAVFMDISEQKTMQRMLQIESERYRIASELSNDILFEYDIRKDEMFFSEKYREAFGGSVVCENYVKNAELNRDNISPDDWEEYLEFLRKLHFGEATIESQFRIASFHREYIWCNVLGKTVYDINREPVKVLGKIVNVDTYKKELMSLETQATRDPLTGVLNKAVTGNKINTLIEEFPDAFHLLMIVDIDDFKYINDTYGHIIGDEILSYVTKNIRKVFNQSELIGRIGGDEFVVFIGNVLNEADILLKANTLRSILISPYKTKNESISVSGSIGVSIYPKDGKNYQELLECADKALYVTKGNGKNGFTVYEKY